MIRQPYYTFTILTILLLFACEEPTSNSDTIVISSAGATAALSLIDSTVQKQDTTVSKVKSRGLSNPQSLEKSPFEYDLGNPNFVGVLPSGLLEISALTYNKIDNTLLAINDERGILYTLNRDDFTLVDKKEFGKNGDYEGIEMVGEMVYVLKSNGTLSPINLYPPRVSDNIKTDLSSDNDVEGLAFDPSTNSLILACKGAPELKKKNKKKLKDSKAFYAFDLEEEELGKKPLFTISDDDLKDFLKDKSLPDLSKKAKKKLKNRITDFSPSAIALHPVEDLYYILSSVGKLLLVCDKEGKLVNVYFLNEKRFSQPEGICFAPDGTLFISNEGRSLKGNIMRFDRLD